MELAAKHSRRRKVERANAEANDVLGKYQQENKPEGEVFKA